MPNLLRFFCTGILAGLLLFALSLVNTNPLSNFIAPHPPSADKTVPVKEASFPDTEGLNPSNTGSAVSENVPPPFFSEQALAHEPAEEEIDPNPKIAYLTFDDGPSESITLKILETARNYQIKLTFFVIGSMAEKNPEILRQAIQEGHAIGNHSYTHNYRQIYRSPDSLIADINQCAEILEEAIGFRPSLFRAPGGSKPFLRPELILELNNAGYEYYDWNVCPGDSVGKPKSSQTLINTVLEQAEGKERIIVLLHDSPNMHTTAEALPGIIEGLEAMEFTFAALTPTTEPIQF